MPPLFVPANLSITALNTVLTGDRNTNRLTKKVLVLYSEIIRKMFKNGFKVESIDARFVQIGLAEREAIFRKMQSKVFDLLIKSNYLEVLDGLDEGTGEYIAQVYSYGKKGGEAKRYAIPLWLWGTSPKYKIIDDNSSVIDRAIKGLKARKAKVVKAIEEQALKDMLEALKKVKFCEDKVTQAILKNNIGIELLNRRELSGLSLLDYVDYLNDSEELYSFHDYFGERLQHYKLNIPKVLRYCALYFEGYKEQKVVELDLANSQPFFLCCLTPEIIKRIIPECHSKELVDIVVKMRQSESFRRFRASCIAGTLKADFCKIFGSKFSETEIKEIIFAVMYCNYEKKNSKYRMQLDAFKNEYPDVYEALAAIKKLDWQHLKENCSKRTIHKGSYTNASMIIQRLESRIMLLHLVPAINRDELIENMTFFTIHDSVVCLERDKKRVEELIKKTFKELGLDQPMINQKDD